MDKSPIFYDDKHNRLIKFRKGLEDRKFDISLSDSTMDTIINKSTNYFITKTKGEEYLVELTMESDATYPYRINFYSNIKDINGDLIPSEINNAFIVSAEPLDLERKVIVTAYDDDGFNIRMGTYGEPITADWTLMFVVRGGY